MASAGALTLVLLSGCGGSGVDPVNSGFPNSGATGGSFVVLSTEPANNGKLFLNDPIRIDFSNPIDITTANLNTVAFTVTDPFGNPIAEQPAGVFRLAASPGDPTVGRRLEFIPKFPTNNSYTDGGFKPARIYTVQLVGGNPRSGNVLLDASGATLASPATYQFSTATGSSPSELFRDTLAGGPRRTGFYVSGGSASALLNKSGQVPVEAVLQFDQPLNPHSENVPVGVDVDPTTRAEGGKGRIFLEYNDDIAQEPNRWVPARVALTLNELSGSEVRLFPVGVLPNNADVKVIVEKSLEDMAGESNIGAAAYNREFATFKTSQAFEPQFDALVDSFDSGDNLDLGAAFLEPIAEVNNGFVKANFDFEGSSTLLQYQPTSKEVILNTDFTQITPSNSAPINVTGGVFQFQSVLINAGVTVRGTGSNPMVWLVTKDFVVNGELNVNGGAGDRVNVLGSANFPTPGGVGNCGGGKGGRGSPNTGGQSLMGEAGFGPGQIPGGGGGGGRLSYNNSQCGRGSGGGGGSLASAGDPWFKAKQNGAKFVQQNGRGGFGCTGQSGTAKRTMPGGLPGPLAFTDPRDDNNFWGSGINIDRQIRITGELAMPIAGSGSGGGGDRAPQLGNTNWISNNKGGGGGGGAGVLVVKALGDIVIGPTGKITADGGTGGGGEQAGGNNQGGGGAGGCGGMVVLMAAGQIRFTAHAETYAKNNYSFAISADGSVGTQGRFGGLEWLTKYPPPGNPPNFNGALWDNAPSGALGGMGVVQLMAPAGDDSADGDVGGPDEVPYTTRTQGGAVVSGTGTGLDDNIVVLDSGGQPLKGYEKVRYLAWRGFPNQTGLWVDDYGMPTYNNSTATANYPAWATQFGPDSEGDIRPAPILLPAPFGDKSRVRSRWMDVGAGSVRVPTKQYGFNGPRRITENPGQNMLAGPRYVFAGTNAEAKGNWVGYVNYSQNGVGGIDLDFRKVVEGVQVGGIVTTNSYQGEVGRTAYQVTLVQSVLGQIADRYAQYQAELIDNGRVAGTYRVMSHTDRTLFLSPDQGALPVNTAGLTLNLVERFFDIRTQNAPGLGPTYFDTVTQRQVPVANVRVGFAFHKDPQQALASGNDPLRFPNQVGTFLYDLGMDLSDPRVQEQIRSGVFSLPSGFQIGVQPGAGGAASGGGFAPAGGEDPGNSDPRTNHGPGGTVTFQGGHGTPSVSSTGAGFVMWDLLFNMRFSETAPNNQNLSQSLSPSSPRPEVHFLVLPYRY